MPALLTIDERDRHRGNTAYVGGGIYNSGGSLAIDGGLISGNVAVADGGAIDDASGGAVAITGSTISGNTGGHTAAVSTSTVAQ